MEALRQRSSPLDSLSRTSSRRTKPPPPLFAPPDSPVPDPPHEPWQKPKSGGLSSPERDAQLPISPLLHTQFNRGSTTTHVTTMADGPSLYQESFGRPLSSYPDDESVYSQDYRSTYRALESHNDYRGPTPLTEQPLPPRAPNLLALSEEEVPYRQSWESPESRGVKGSFQDRELVVPDSLTSVPTVVISSPSDIGYGVQPAHPLSSSEEARVRSAIPTGYNFSKPVRFATPQMAQQYDLSDAEGKLAVIERNKSRSEARTPRKLQKRRPGAPIATKALQADEHSLSSQPSSNRSSSPKRPTSDLEVYPTHIDPIQSNSHLPPTFQPRSFLREPESQSRSSWRSPSPPHVQVSTRNQARSRSPPANIPGLLRSPSSSSSQHNDMPRTPPQHSPLVDPSSFLEPPSAKNGGHFIHLPNRPYSPHPDSPATSVYSQYSFYQLEGQSSSPTASTGSGFHGSAVPSEAEHHAAAEKRAKRASKTLGGLLAGGLSAVSPGSVSPKDTNSLSDAQIGPPAPEDLLQEGIQHHEANRLKESAISFELSATEQGGCGAGMLMWGLSLRHGWGCRKDEKSGFKWLRKAAEAAVGDLESARSGGQVDQNAIQAELIMAIYEVGQCYFRGWGVPKDLKMGVSYFRVAAQLGDADAQQELGFCLTNGKGCKKNRKDAAKWYCLAVAQGISDVGLAWIYKDKYQ